MHAAAISAQELLSAANQLSEAFPDTSGYQTPEPQARLPLYLTRLVWLDCRAREASNCDGLLFSRCAVWDLHIRCVQWQAQRVCGYPACTEPGVDAAILDEQSKMLSRVSRS